MQCFRAACAVFSSRRSKTFLASSGSVQGEVPVCSGGIILLPGFFQPPQSLCAYVLVAGLVCRFQQRRVAAGGFFNSRPNGWSSCRRGRHACRAVC